MANSLISHRNICTRKIEIMKWKKAKHENRIGNDQPSFEKICILHEKIQIRGEKKKINKKLSSLFISEMK